MPCRSIQVLQFTVPLRSCRSGCVLGQDIYRQVLQVLNHRMACLQGSFLSLPFPLFGCQALVLTLKHSLSGKQIGKAVQSPVHIHSEGSMQQSASGLPGSFLSKQTLVCTLCLQPRACIYESSILTLPSSIRACTTSFNLRHQNEGKGTTTGNHLKGTCRVIRGPGKERPR